MILCWATAVKEARVRCSGARLVGDDGPRNWLDARAVPCTEHRRFGRSRAGGEPFALIVDADAAVEALVHFDMHPGIADTCAAREDLDPLLAELHGVVRGDDAAVFEAEQLLRRPFVVQRTIGQLVTRGRHGEARIEPR